jgi:hypothetical protein
MKDKSGGIDLISRKKLIEEEYSQNKDLQIFWTQTYISYKSKRWLDFRNTNRQKNIIFTNDTSEDWEKHQLQAGFTQNNPVLVTFIEDLKKEAFTQLNDILAELNDSEKLEASVDSFNPITPRQERAIEAELSWTENEAVDLYVRTFLNIDSKDINEG